MPFLLRDASAADLDGVHGVARHLDSVNLPDDRAHLEKLIERAERSFAGKIEPSKREFLFVLEDLDAGKVVGVSMIFAQHGSRRSPHIYFDVLDEERYSETLDKHFTHTVLRLGSNYRGLTEIGGLAILPAYRGHKEQLGKLLSYVRFLYIAIFRPVFKDEVVSELMPPLEEDGTSLLWESLGRRFTGLDYQEADRLSHENKEFIRTLFPQEPLYASLLPKNVQDLIGQVGPETKGVERMLRAIGFEYAHRIDPFDGGPHFHAKTDQITLVKATRRVAVGGGDGGTTTAIVARAGDVAPYFRAVRAGVSLEGGRVSLPAAARALLAVAPGDEVAVLPLSGVDGRPMRAES